MRDLCPLVSELSPVTVLGRAVWALGRSVHIPAPVGSTRTKLVAVEAETQVKMRRMKRQGQDREEISWAEVYESSWMEMCPQNIHVQNLNPQCLRI